MTHTFDLTCIYITANVIPEGFANAAKGYLLEAIGDLPLISVSQKPMDFGLNINVGDELRSHVNIYRQALIGADAAKTKYIAIAEDDVLYSPEHFKYRPRKKPFAYNMGFWNVFTWSDPLFTHKGGGRRNLSQLICEREVFIEAMEERFNKYPDESKINIDLWAEPSKYERQLGVTVREHEEFYSQPPNIVFSHQTALSWDTIGDKKRKGEFRAERIPYWGEANDIGGLYQ